ncbi:hypothetical protein FS749_005085, partial [Ceratobasidium sp. UAMH 11750]
KSRTTNTGALTSTASNSLLSLPPSPAPSRPANRDVTTAPKGTQKKCNAPDTVEQPAPAKKQKAAMKEVTTKRGKQWCNAATNRTDSWSASYREEETSLPPPQAPEKAKKKAADPPARPAPGPSDASAPSDPSTSASKPCRRPPYAPPLASPPA